MDSINKRIREIRIRYCNDSNIVFARRLKKKPNTVNNWVREGYSVGRGVMAQILGAFPCVDEEWLRSGTGEMEREVTLGVEENRTEGKVIPLFDNDTALPGEHETETADFPDEEMVEIGWMLRDCDYALRIYGSGMEPVYPPGSIVGLRPHTESFIVPGNVYVIETREGRYIRRLYMNDESNGFRCMSDNHMKHKSGPMAGEYLYPEFEIPCSEVVRLHNVIGVIKRDAI